MHWSLARIAHTARHRLAMLAILLPVTLPWPLAAAETGFRIPAGVVTHADGRRPIESLYATYAGLVARGWTLDVVAESQPAGTAQPLPSIALRSPVRGPAIWILSGIHGEEPAGPNAIAEAIADIAALGEKRPVVLMPLLNPQGYARNCRRSRPGYQGWRATRTALPARAGSRCMPGWTSRRTSARGSSACAAT